MEQLGGGGSTIVTAVDIGSLNTEGDRVLEQIQVHVEVWRPLSVALGPNQRGSVLLQQQLVEDGTLGELIDQLVGDYPNLGPRLVQPESHQLHDHVAVMINGRLLQLAGRLETKLGDGDKVTLLAAFGGGVSAFPVAFSGPRSRPPLPPF